MYFFSLFFILKSVSNFFQAYTLLLGLGYLEDYKNKDIFTPVKLKEFAKQIDYDLTDDSNHEGLKLQTLLTIVATVSIVLARFVPRFLINISLILIKRL